MQKRNLARLGAAAGAMVCLVFAVRREYSLLGVSDAFAVAGLLFLILALFRTARYMRFYDLPIYGFKKFVEIWRVKEPSSKNSKLCTSFSPRSIRVPRYASASGPARRKAAA